MPGASMGPDYIDPFGCPVEESSKYALAPNTRWTSLRYGECRVMRRNQIPADRSEDLRKK